MTEEEQLKQMAAQMRAAEYKGLSEAEIQEKERQKEMKRKKNIEILEDTLGILEKGSYSKDGQEIKLRFSKEQMQEAQVFLPDDIEALRAKNDCQAQDIHCVYGCENTDALVLAQKKYQTSSSILVLNMASATQPGGQTRKGASAQEEALCSRTSLLLSLESESAKKYYDYNVHESNEPCADGVSHRQRGTCSPEAVTCDRRIGRMPVNERAEWLSNSARQNIRYDNLRKTHMGSDAIILSPYVEVIKDFSSETLAEPFPVSVMSCAAPMIRLGLEGMSQQEYEAMLYKRIEGMLLVAASQNYRHLILGAFGCGVFGNDAAVVSDLFAKAIRSSSQSFASIDFAVLCCPDKDYNYREFCRNFSGKKL